MRKLLFISMLALTIVGCTTTKTVETPPGSGNFQQVAEVDPRLTKTLGTIGGLSQAAADTGVNPWNTPIQLGLGSIAAIATWWATRKTTQLNQSNTLLKTVVQGVEQADNKEVKQAIQAHAVNVGIEGKLGDVVAKINSGT